jgi:hypothetical protein
MFARAVFVCFALSLTLLPALMVTLDRGAMAPFWFLAGDAYLYLGIAQASEGLGFSFDGERATNGFHPLWQVWVRLLSVLSPGGPLGVMHAVLWSGVALVAVGVVALGHAIARLTGSWALALLAVPGVWFLMVGQGFQNLPVWAFLDGMEAALAFALAGVLALMIARYPGPAAAGAGVYLRLGLLLAVLVLTRLDEVFLTAAIALTVLAWPGAPRPRRFLNATLIALPGVLAVAAYVVWSHATTGLPLPVSGAAKGEGGILGNIWVTLATLFGPMQDLRAALTSYETERAVLYGAAFRVVQLLGPAAFAALWVWVFWRWFRSRPWAVLMVGLGAGVLLKAGYNFAFVNFWHQAGWYYAVAMMATTLATALLLTPIWDALVVRSRATAPLTALALGGFGLFHASLWGAMLLTQPRHAVQMQFWLDREGTTAALTSAAPGLKLIEFGDGAVNFSLSTIPTRHGFVFAGDTASLRALQAGRLLHASHDDGFQVLTSYEYLHVPPGAEGWDSDTIRAFLAGSFLDRRVKGELDLFDYAMLHVWRPEPGAPGVPFIALTPRGADEPEPEPAPQG